MLPKRTCTVTILVSLLSCFSVSQADEFEIPWFTVDGGGGTSEGGDFRVAGTLGQPDAGPADGALSGGAFELVGGFWPRSTVCACPGDTNGDGVVNGSDIQAFVHCIVLGAECRCANVDGTAGVDENDISVFVNGLLTGVDCR